jgi:RNA polymerase sigma-70 factor (ECF subfamily)
MLYNRINKERSGNLEKLSVSASDRVSIALENYSDRVYRICYLYLKNKAEAEDAFQDVFLKFMQMDKEFENDEHEKAWICRVAINRCKDIMKSFRYKFVSLDKIPELTFENEENSVVLEAILNLPPKYKDIVYLHYYEGYKASQIASLLNSNENTVYSQLSRARTLLKERLGEDYEC